jgi:hypothetical protein
VFVVLPVVVFLGVTASAAEPTGHYRILRTLSLNK